MKPSGEKTVETKTADKLGSEKDNGRDEEKNSEGGNLLKERASKHNDGPLLEEVHVPCRRRSMRRSVEQPHNDDSN